MSRDMVRWARHRLAVERWKIRNYDYYLQQKRELAARPEYLAHRRRMYALRKAARSSDQTADLSTQESLHELEETGERTDQRLDSSGSAATSAPIGNRFDTAQWAPEEGVGGSEREADGSGVALLRADGTDTARSL